MAIKCCQPCKPPKRYPGCSDHCPEYAKERAQHDKDMAEYRRQKAIQSGITSQKYDGVYRANRKKGRK